MGKEAKKWVFLSWPNMALTNMGLKDQNWSHFWRRENGRERGREEKERRRKKNKRKRKKMKEPRSSQLGMELLTWYGTLIFGMETELKYGFMEF